MSFEKTSNFRALTLQRKLVIRHGNCVLAHIQFKTSWPKSAALMQRTVPITLLDSPLIKGSSTKDIIIIKNKNILYEKQLSSYELLKARLEITEGHMALQKKRNAFQQKQIEHYSTYKIDNRLAESQWIIMNQKLKLALPPKHFQKTLLITADGKVTKMGLIIFGRNQWRSMIAAVMVSSFCTYHAASSFDSQALMEFVMNSDKRHTFLSAVNDVWTAKYQALKTTNLSDSIIPTKTDIPNTAIDTEISKNKLNSFWTNWKMFKTFNNFDD